MVSIVEACACPRCDCKVDHQDPQTVLKGDRYYCSQSCASGHAQKAGCGHTGCNCYSLPEDEPRKYVVDQAGIIESG